jgi:hypothetical protein
MHRAGFGLFLLWGKRAGNLLAINQISLELVFRRVEE